MKNAERLIYIAAIAALMAWNFYSSSAAIEDVQKEATVSNVLLESLNVQHCRQLRWKILHASGVLAHLSPKEVDGFIEAPVPASDKYPGDCSERALRIMVEQFNSSTSSTAR